MRSILLKVIFLLVPLFSYSQKETNIWYFGPDGAGLDFNDCTVTVVTNGWTGPYPLFEGSATMCDSNGTLLFYTSGVTVINANHAVMQNGTNLGLTYNTISQNLIVKQPGSTSIYYIISPDVQGYAGMLGNPLASIIYAEIDMSLDNGLGGVVSFGNVLRDTLSGRSCEKLTAVKHANGTDAWIIAHEYGNSNFLAYLVTSAGISTTPVISPSGPSIAYSSGYNAMGELKASPDGNRLAFTSNVDGTTGIFDFDKGAGVVSDPLQLDLNENGFIGSGYGVSFSPDNTKLYIGQQVDLTTGFEFSLVQFDLSSGDSATIHDSKTTLFTSTSGLDRLGSLKIGPDSKIYCGRNEGEYLGLIMHPDLAGQSAGYTHNGIYLNGLQATWGLNNAMDLTDYNFCSQELIAYTVSDDIVCSGGCTANASVIAEYGIPPYTYLWSTSETTESISGLCAGTYDVTVTDNSDSSITVPVIINDGLALPISITQNADTLIATTAPNYQWYHNDTLIPGATSQIYIITESGYYYAVSTSGGCTFTSNTLETVCICTSIHEIDFSHSVFLYPNPVSSSLTVQLAFIKQRSVFRVYSAQGQLITSGLISGPQTSLDVSLLSAGLYYLALQNSRGVATKKFEVMR